MKRKTISPIAIWSGLSPDKDDVRTHYWYEDTEGSARCLCDDTGVETGILPLQADTPEIKCRDCQDLYIHDLAFGKHLLEYAMPPTPRGSRHPQHLGVYSQEIREYPLKMLVGARKSGGVGMQQQVSVGMATFARYYAATDVHKVRMVKDARTFHFDKDGYKKRDYYWDFTNTLKSTHWRTDDLADFESKVDQLVARQLKQSRAGKHIDRRNNYRALADAYCKFVNKEKASVFLIPPGHLDIGGIRITINPDIGMRFHGDLLALGLWLAAPKPTRPFRQAVQYLMEEAKRRGWQPNLQPNLWDIRRELILPRPPMPRDIADAIEGQAAAFLYTWNRLEN